MTARVEPSDAGSALPCGGRARNLFRAIPVMCLHELTLARGCALQSDAAAIVRRLREGVTQGQFDRESSHVTCSIDFVPTRTSRYNFRARTRGLSCAGPMAVVAYPAAPFWPMDDASAIVQMNPAAPAPLRRGDAHAQDRCSASRPEIRTSCPSEMAAAAIGGPQTICLTIRGLLSGRCEREEASKLRPCKSKERAR